MNEWQIYTANVCILRSVIWLNISNRHRVHRACRRKHSLDLWQISTNLALETHSHPPTYVQHLRIQSTRFVYTKWSTFHSVQRVLYNHFVFVYGSNFIYWTGSSVFEWFRMRGKHFFLSHFLWNRARFPIRRTYLVCLCISARVRCQLCKINVFYSHRFIFRYKWKDAY